MRTGFDILRNQCERDDGQHPRYGWLWSADEFDAYDIVFRDMLRTKKNPSNTRDLSFLSALRLRILMAALALLLLAYCPSGAPKEAKNLRSSDLVEITKLDPSIRLDIRYATADNFVHRPVYRQARAFLQRPAAEALVRGNASLKPKGYGLLVFDAYRPWSVTKIFWDTASKKEREIGFVSNPKKGSRHNRGCAVDLSLYDLQTGLEVPMPSTFDEFSERASPKYAGGPEKTRATRDLLRKAMEAEGFVVNKSEWWHFDYRDWQRYSILDIPFEEFPVQGSAFPVKSIQR
jgi:zinc D-Ala-D-Ala dipeptidase